MILQRIETEKSDKPAKDSGRTKPEKWDCCLSEIFLTQPNCEEVSGGKACAENLSTQKRNGARPDRYSNGAKEKSPGVVPQRGKLP